ncbi:MAG: hypothetical protein FWC22_00895 [Treponema sp.]|nr:hypothetical protein [Treponema sp.]
MSGEKDAKIEYGDFGENFVVDGIDFGSLKPGTILEYGGVILQITQIGKECHSRCVIYNVMATASCPAKEFSRR